jgi:hypothetical protein
MELPGSADADGERGADQLALLRLSVTRCGSTAYVIAFSSLFRGHDPAARFRLP